ncbi:CHAP domain-containing protein [Haematospirillum jordaniae]|uniref:CHAP domain-containing protein n=1 Tax=Haematospirillum jordaniae TaxID=1549855 RepID=UPI00143309FF|nr:CHAP domain-containing protein [Haematospirillum jordaniae]NKD84788.1 CHAP domain-containing protein [Haematospirillum jordaniae]
MSARLLQRSILALTLLAFVCLAQQALAAWSCVPYARSISDIHLQGDAWRWWDASVGVYQRGKKPTVGSVLVFKRSPIMRRGHVAVVRSVEGTRKILVDHANWSRSGRIETQVAVVDISPGNDWSQTRVWHSPSRTLGSTIYQTAGFIYPEHASSASLDKKPRNAHPL